MESKFDNVKKEMQLYIVGFVFELIINVAFFTSLPDIINESSEEDMPFIWLAGFAAIGSLIALIIHFIMYLGATKNIRKNQ
jgi:heme/copper-type cytochrome/quinol oxidase subunit 4